MIAVNIHVFPVSVLVSVFSENKTDFIRDRISLVLVHMNMRKSCSRLSIWKLIDRIVESLSSKANKLEISFI